MSIRLRIGPAKAPVDRVIEAFWELYATELDSAAEEIISPDGRCELAVHLTDPPARILAGKTGHGSASVFFGPITSALRLRQKGPSHMRGLRFRLTGLAGLGVKPEAWRNTGAPIRDALGALGEALEEAAFSADGFDAFANQCERKIERAMRSYCGETDDLDLEPLLARIESGLLNRRKDIAAFSGWTERHTTRLVKAQTGHTPSELARISRFHRARVLTLQTQLSLTQIANLADYADLAHMMKEFERFALKSPGALRRNSGLFADIYS